MSLDLEQLAAIIEQLDTTEFTDFLYEQGDTRIRVSRGGSIDGSAPSSTSQAAAPAPTTTPAAPTPPANGTDGSANGAETPASAPTQAAPATASKPTGQAPTAQASTAQPSGGLDPEDLPAGHQAVRAPMLGTFYSAPKPGEPAFVSPGDAVETDSVIGIIEVMKLMNSVPAGIEGEVVEVLAKDGEMVEHDQPIAVIRTDSDA